MLERTVSSISGSIKYLYNRNNDVKVVISWVDDASTDNTLDEASKLKEVQDPIIRESFFIHSLSVNSGAAYCRNLAAALYNADYICPFDSDDEMYENHLSVCLDLMDLEDNSGQKCLAGSTHLDISIPVEPEWVGRISYAIPITKIVHRKVWNFVEGMPTDYVYKKIGGEDQAFMDFVQKFFSIAITTKVTAKYWSYPGSALDNQSAIFLNQKQEEPEESLFSKLVRLREQIKCEKLEYLGQKAAILGFPHNF